MPSTSQLIKLHRRGLKKTRNTQARLAGFTLVFFMSIMLFGGVIGLISFYTLATRNLPTLDVLPILLDPNNGSLMQPTQFYDRTGSHVIYTVQNPAIESRQYLFVTKPGTDPIEGSLFSSSLLTATIAISDPTFWDNPGYSLQGIRENEQTTIAQRLVSELLLWDEQPGIQRAIRERVLAAQITSRFGREQVIEWYLNTTNYGSLAFGADSAAHIYFGKSASEINLAEAAILAGVSQFPELNPFSSPQTALERGEIVIDAMEGQGSISSEEAEKARDTEIRFAESEFIQNNLTSQFIELVWQHLLKTIPVENVERGGYQIITSLDYDLQTQALCTTQVHLSRLNRTASDQESDDRFPKSNLQDCPAAKFLPTLSVLEDSQEQDILANLVIYDPFTSQILALVGEYGTKNTGNISEGHPPGSLFTPFVYLTAFTRGFNPASLLWDIPYETPTLPITQLNPTADYKGPLRLRNALATDTLIPAGQLINQIGIKNILKIARQLGLYSLDQGDGFEQTNHCPGCNLILDEGQISLLEAVQAFGVFAHQGYLVGLPSEDADLENQRLLPATILGIKDPTHQFQQANVGVEVRPVISPQLAYMMTHILSDEAARWPRLNHPNPLEIGRPAGAKIGTTTNGNDTWTVGFTPQLVVGVWMGTPGHSDRSHLPGNLAATLWHAVIQYAVQDHPPNTWSMPPGVTTMDVCDPSGMLPTLQCPSVVKEIFLTGQEPTQPDNLYQVYQINRETGRLATVFSPPELIEEKTYLNIPAEAREWAESIGLDTPPDTYDLIRAPAMMPDVAIESPGMFSYIKGEIEIQGSAFGSGFNAYRLQAGEGINPSGWLVIKEETSTPVSSGLLGTWDTSNLNGLYALQLIVLRENQRVDTTTIQVTIDNEPPQIKIMYPDNLEIFSARSSETITFLVDATDNLGLERVEYYINGKLVSTQTQYPFAYPWRSRSGTINLTVKAIDYAENASEAEVTFTIE